MKIDINLFIFKMKTYQKHFIFFDFACRAVSMDVQLNSESQEYLWIMPEERFELPIDPYTLRTMDAYLKIHSPG